MGFMTILAWAAITEYYRLGGLNNKVMSQVLDAEKSRVKVSAETVPGASPLPDATGAGKGF